MSEQIKEKTTTESGSRHEAPAKDDDAKAADSDHDASVLREKLLRALADAENARKRAAAARGEGRNAGLADAVNALLPALDNIELAFKNRPQASDAPVAALFDGVEATRRVFLDGLKSLGIERIDPVGQPFDPKVCEAVSVRDEATAPANTVIETVQPGYRRGEQLIRPAMVIVAKAKNVAGGP